MHGLKITMMPFPTVFHAKLPIFLPVSILRSAAGHGVRHWYFCYERQQPEHAGNNERQDR